MADQIRVKSASLGFDISSKPLSLELKDREDRCSGRLNIGAEHITWLRNDERRPPDDLSVGIGLEDGAVTVRVVDPEGEHSGLLRINREQIAWYKDDEDRPRRRVLLDAFIKVAEDG